MATGEGILLAISRLEFLNCSSGRESALIGSSGNGMIRLTSDATSVHGVDLVNRQRPVRIAPRIKAADRAELAMVARGFVAESKRRDSGVALENRDADFA